MDVRRQAYKSGMHRQAYLRRKEGVGCTLEIIDFYRVNDSGNMQQEFSIVLMGNALKHTGVFLLASVPALTFLHPLCLSGQAKYSNTTNRRMVKRKGRERNGRVRRVYCH